MLPWFRRRSLGLRAGRTNRALRKERLLQDEQLDKWIWWGLVEDRLLSRSGLCGLDLLLRLKMRRRGKGTDGDWEGSFAATLLLSLSTVFSTAKDRRFVRPERERARGLSVGQCWDMESSEPELVLPALIMSGLVSTQPRFAALI